MIKLIKCNDYAELDTVLNGGVFFGKEIPFDFTALIGKTLTFIKPAGSVTFVANGSGGLTFSDFKQQVETTVSNTLVKNAAPRGMGVTQADGSAEVVIDKTSSANAALGLSSGNDTAGLLLFPSTSEEFPRMTHVVVTNENSFVIFYATE